MNEKKLNTWYNDLCGVPSQCYYYFMHENLMYCVYLRCDIIGLWQTEIFKCADGGFDFRSSESDLRLIKTPYFVEDELDKFEGIFCAPFRKIPGAMAFM